jgi:spore germination cell wall hydrolase CwlJ-like protein
MPVLHNLVINFGEKPQLPKRIPTVDDPKWTGSFDDDPEDILLARLIFGEARNQPREAKAGVVWTVKNRLRAQRSDWGFSYHEVIQKPGQYAAMDKRDNNFPKLIDPLNTDEPGADEAWHECYQVAQEVIGGVIEDPTEGAVFFHSADYPQERFVTRDVPGAIFIKQIGDILFYRK